MNFDWAVNKSKMERAIKEVRGDNELTGEVGTKEVTEEAVKIVYVRLLGLLKEDAPSPDAPRVRRRRK